MVDQFSQHHFLKRLSFLHYIFLPLLSKIRCPWVCGFISGDLISELLLESMGGKDKRRRGRQRMRWLDGIIDLMDMNLSKL